MAVQESTRTILVVVVSSIKVHKVPIVKLWPRHICTVVISYVSTNVPMLRYLTQAITSDHIMNDLDITTDASCVDDGFLEEKIWEVRYHL